MTKKMVKDIWLFRNLLSVLPTPSLGLMHVAVAAAAADLVLAPCPMRANILLYICMCMCIYFSQKIQVKYNRLPRKLCEKASHITSQDIRTSKDGLQFYVYKVINMYVNVQRHKRFTVHAHTHTKVPQNIYTHIHMLNKCPSILAYLLTKNEEGPQHTFTPTCKASFLSLHRTPTPLIPSHISCLSSYNSDFVRTTNVHQLYFTCLKLYITHMYMYVYV